MSDSLRGADLVTRVLAEAGVEHLFTLSGNQIMPVFDATIGTGIQLIHVRHEASAVHMADAWGRLTGRPGIALVTAGPGFANTLSALYVARMAESPVVLLSGHAPISGLGRGAFQEMDQTEMAGHVSKASWLVDDVSELVGAVARALRMAAAGRPGPVHVALPFDVLESKVASAGEFDTSADREPENSAAIDKQLVKQILDVASNSTYPLILTGPGIRSSESRSTIDRLGESLSVPVVAMESPRGINDPSLGALAELLPQCDLIVLVGKKLDFTVPRAGDHAISETCQFVQIDADQSVLDQTDRVAESARLLAVRGDPLVWAARLSESAAASSTKSLDWRAEVAEAVSYRPAEWSSINSSDGCDLHAVEVGRAVGRFLSRDDRSVFISDGGEFGQWVQAVVQARFRIINGPSGAIGSAIPFAVAARLARPESRIVTMLGDGTFGFQPFEFDTARRYDLPFVAVVGNDAMWNAEHQIQLRKYGADRAIACQLLPTRYDQVVEALGGYGADVQRYDQLDDAIQEAHASGLPACVNVKIRAEAAPVIRR